MAGILLILWILMVLSVSTLQAQQVSPIRATRIFGFVGLGLDKEDDSRETKQTGEEIRDDDREIYEELGLGVDGYIYHPRLIEFNIETEMQFIQEKNDNNFGFDDDNKQRFYNYNVFTQILKQHPVSFWLSANRSTDEINSSFFPRNRIIKDTYGGGVRFQNRLFPTRVSYSSYTADGEGSNETDDDIDIFSMEISNDGRFGRSVLRYENQDWVQRSIDLDYDIDRLDFQNSFYFGDRKRDWLYSSLRWREQEGTRFVRDMNMDESMILRHTDDFETFYDYTYDDTKQEDRVATRYFYRAGYRHYLYDSLFTESDVKSERFELDSGKEDTIGARFQLRYEKRIPYGILYLDSDLLFENQDEDFSGEKEQIVKEKHTFGEVQKSVIFLDQDLVDEDSIELLDDQTELPILDPNTGLPIIEGFNYVVETQGLLTRIRLLSPDGDFLEDEMVLVNYEFEPQPPIEFNTSGQRYAARLFLRDTWEIFYDGRRTEQSLQDGFDFGRLDDITERNYGSNIYWRNTETRVSKTVRHSNRNPFERKIYSEEIWIPLKRSSSLRLYGSYFDTTSLFGKEEQTIDRLLSARLFMLLPKRATWDIEVRYRNEDQVGEDIKSVQYITHFRWRFRKFYFELTYDDTDWDREITGDERQKRLYIRARRYFGR